MYCSPAISIQTWAGTQPGAGFRGCGPDRTEDAWASGLVPLSAHPTLPSLQILVQPSLCTHPGTWRSRSASSWIRKTGAPSGPPRK